MQAEVIAHPNKPGTGVSPHTECTVESCFYRRGTVTDLFQRGSSYLKGSFFCDEDISNMKLIVRLNRAHQVGNRSETGTN